MSSTPHRYFGQGYPFGNTLKSYFDTKYDLDILRSSIINIVFTIYGERVMLPNFGSSIPETPFAQNDELTASIVRSDLTTAVTFWDPRIEVVSVSVSTDPSDPKLLAASVTYRDVNQPQTVDSFAFTLGPSYDYSNQFEGPLQ